MTLCMLYLIIYFLPVIANKIIFMNQCDALWLVDATMVNTSDLVTCPGKPVRNLLQLSYALSIYNSNAMTWLV